MLVRTIARMEQNPFLSESALLAVARRPPPSIRIAAQHVEATRLKRPKSAGVLTAAQSQLNRLANVRAEVKEYYDSLAAERTPSDISQRLTKGADRAVRAHMEANNSPFEYFTRDPAEGPDPIMRERWARAEMRLLRFVRHGKVVVPNALTQFTLIPETALDMSMGPVPGKPSQELLLHQRTKYSQLRARSADRPTSKQTQPPVVLRPPSPTHGVTRPRWPVSHSRGALARPPSAASLRHHEAAMQHSASAPSLGPAAALPAHPVSWSKPQLSDKRGESMHPRST